jgi:hypothetical protein
VPETPTPQTTAKPLRVRPDALTPEQVEAIRVRRLPLVNGIPYEPPTAHIYFSDYLHDTYGLNGFIRSNIRALYNQALDEPKEWDTDFEGYGQRYISSEGVTVINGNVRLGMEFLFHEDLRYIPCHGCSIKRKIANAWLAEFTARHGADGHRTFTLTPVVADFSGPIIAHSLWYPHFDPFAGVVATRTVFATRVGLHLVQEFLPQRHKNSKNAPK